MIATFFKVIFYVLAGFFLYTINLVSYGDAPEEQTKWLNMIVIFVGIALFFMLIAIAIGKFRNWQKPVAATFFTSGGLAALLPMFVWPMVHSDMPAFQAEYGEGMQRLISNIPTGIGITVLYMLIGAGCMYLANRKTS